MQHLGRCGRVELVDELGDRHAGNEMAASQSCFGAAGTGNDRVDAVVGTLDALHFLVQSHFAATPFDLGLEGSPHHARPETRIVEFFDQGGDLGAGLDDHAQ